MQGEGEGDDSKGEVSVIVGDRTKGRGAAPVLKRPATSETMYKPKDKFYH